MEKTLAEAENTEASALETFRALQNTKSEEIEYASEAVETKSVRLGELAVAVAQNTAALENSEKEVESSQQFSSELKSSCAAKEKEYAVSAKTHTEEVAAIGEAIAVLTSDDAAETFAKTSLAQT